MNLLLVALDQQGYQQIKPIVDKLIEADERMEADWHRELKEDDNVTPKQLRFDVEKLETEVVRTGIRVAVRKDNLWEDLQEITAYNDLTETIGRIKPETEELLTELDDYLLPANKLSQLFPRFTSLLQSLNLEQVIKSHAYFRDEIPPRVYLTALDKNNRMMDFCVKHGLALLSIVTGED
jgi:hypothetical protein